MEKIGYVKVEADQNFTDEQGNLLRFRVFHSDDDFGDGTYKVDVLWIADNEEEEVLGCFPPGEFVERMEALIQYIKLIESHHAHE